MYRENKVLEVLLISPWPDVFEDLKKCLSDGRVKPIFDYFSSSAEITNLKDRHIHAVFIYSNRLSQKIINDVRYLNQLIPRAAIVMLSPDTDSRDIVEAIRAGLFDYICLPVDKHNLKRILSRLKIHRAIQGEQWTTDRAILHLFSGLEKFSTLADIASRLITYLSLFLKIDQGKEIKSSDQLLKLIKLKKKLGMEEKKKLLRFFNDEWGLVFGLGIQADRFHFLLKKDNKTLSYHETENISHYSLKDILSPYFVNILKTSLSLLALEKKREESRILSLTDEITGLYNQRKLNEDLDFFIEKYKFDKKSFSLLFVDIDYFKNVNDRFGHLIGSQLLIDMSEVIRAQLRSYDLMYRYGGDEFIILLPKTSLEESKKIACRVLKSVRGADFYAGGMKYQLSLSIGVAQFPSDATSAKAIIDFADRMMYQSKKTGRGKVFHVSEVRL